MENVEIFKVTYDISGQSSKYEFFLIKCSFLAKKLPRSWFQANQKINFLLSISHMLSHLTVVVALHCLPDHRELEHMEEKVESDISHVGLN